MFRPAKTAVYDKGKLLEGKETNTERQQNMFQGKIRMKSKIQVFNEKIIIFKIEKQSEISPVNSPILVQSFVRA